MFDEATNDALYPDQFLTGSANDHAILDYKLALSSSYTYAPNNEEGIEGPSPFWRFGAAILSRFSEISKNEGFDFTANLHKFTTRVLFLYSGNNRAYGQAFANKLASAYSNAQVAEVKDTGHEMIYFKWNTVYPLVLPYLDSLR